MSDERPSEKRCPRCQPSHPDRRNELRIVRAAGRKGHRGRARRDRASGQHRNRTGDDLDSRRCPFRSQLAPQLEAGFNIDLRNLTRMFVAE